MSDSRKRNGDNKIKEIASYVCEKLLDTVVIHRYDAYSTNSVYLKFDYGICNSLRISDHDGKEHLAYRYTILTSIDKPYSKTVRDFTCYVYPASMVDEVIEMVKKKSAEARGKYNNYAVALTTAKNRGLERPGFWKGAYRVSRKG